MKYCPECGKENQDEAEFCKHCGVDLTKSVTYRKRRDTGWDLARVFAVLMGGLLVLVAFGLIMGGSTMRVVNKEIIGSDGYIMTGVERLQSNSYAIVFEDIDINIDDDSERIAQRFSNLVTFKMTAESNTPGEEVFIGLIQDNSAQGFLEDVEYDRLVGRNWEYDPWSSNFPDYTLVHSDGTRAAVTPLVLSSWIEHASGQGEQTITWNPVEGNYWVIVMNADGSAGVDADFQMGVKTPLLKSIGDILLTAGLAIGLIGAYLVYIAVNRR